jgi:hypothetical protein
MFLIDGFCFRNEIDFITVHQARWHFCFIK